MKPKARTENLVIQNTDGETLVYDLLINKAFLLNETAAFVWNACDGETEVSLIKQKLAKRFQSNADEELVWLAVQQLQKDGLMTSEELPRQFAAMNRREVIRKVGLASMIALPMVSAIVAPTAAHAASVREAALCERCGIVISEFVSCAPGAGSCNTSITGGQICSVATGPGGEPRGYQFPGFNSCNGAASICCSGTATFNSTTGSCTCN